MVLWLPRTILKYYVLIFLLCGFFVLHCQKSTSNNTIVIGIRADFDSLNELNAADTDALQVIRHLLFMPLTRLDKNLNIVPCLAESWVFSDSNRVLTFTLRKDAYWTDGQPTTAADVLFTYNTATNPEIAYPAASRFDLIDHAELLDDFTIQFHLKKAYPDIFFDLQIPVLPQHILGSLSPHEILTGTFNRNPVGNGPFRLSEWRANQAIIFEANDDFVFGAPRLDRIVFSIIPDDRVLLTNLQSGEIDVVPRITPENSAALHASNIIIESFPGKIFTFVGWNLRRPYLTTPVRQALSHAIDKNQIIKTLLSGYGIPAVGPLTPMAWAFDENVKDIDFDRERAKTLLAQQGWRDEDVDGFVEKNGDPLEISIMVNSGSQLRQDVAILVQSQLENIGVKATIQRAEWNLFIEKVFQNAEFDAVILAWDTDFTVHPTDLWHSDAIENGYNFVAYENPRIDHLLELGRNATDRANAQPYWSEFQQIIINDCPYTFLFIQDNIVAYNKRLHGCQFDLRSLYVNIDEWYVK